MNSTPDLNTTHFLHGHKKVGSHSVGVLDLDTSKMLFKNTFTLPNITFVVTCNITLTQ